MLRIGIVGAGVIGQSHASAIAELQDQQVVAIADPVDALRESLAKACSAPRSYRSWEELVADDALDVVYIGTPNDLHLPIAVAALESGKHVVCEKPLARNAAEGRQMVEAADRTGRKLYVALNHRFWPPNQKVKQMLEAGEIGRPILAMSTFIGNEFDRMNDPDNWKGTAQRSGGGVLIDNGTHMIDLLRWWLGDAVSVTARCEKIGITAPNKEEDTAVAGIEFASGALAELSLTFAARYSAWPNNYVGAAIRTEIYGLEGAIRVGNDGRSVQCITRATERAEFDQSEITTSWDTSMHRHFARCIRGEAEPIVTARDGLMALEIIEAAYRSAESGQRTAVGSLDGHS